MERNRAGKGEHEVDYGEGEKKLQKGGEEYKQRRENQSCRDR